MNGTVISIAARNIYELLSTRFLDENRHKNDYFEFLLFSLHIMVAETAKSLHQDKQFWGLLLLIRK